MTIMALGRRLLALIAAVAVVAVGGVAPALLPAGSRAAEDGPAQWVGGWKLDGRWTVTTAQFRSRGRGSFAPPGSTRPPTSLLNVDLNPRRFRFALPTEGGRLSFAGRMDRGLMEGKVRRLATRGTVQQRGTFFLALPRPLEPPVRATWTGTYHWPGRGFVTLSRSADRRSLALSRGARLQKVYPLSDERLVTADGFILRRAGPPGAPQPDLSALPVGLRPTSRMRPQLLRRAEPVSLRRLAFGGTGGDLYLPAEAAGTRTARRPRSPSAGVPGVVVLHDRGPTTTDLARAFAIAMAFEGVAALLPDAGVDREGGPSPGAQARLAVDALRALGRVDGVAAGAVGLKGSGQAARVAVVAAERSGEARFVVSISGSAVSAGRQRLRAIAHRLTRADADPALRSSVTRLVHAGEEAPWAPSGLSSDPLAALRRLDVPVLALQGALDSAQPAATNAALTAGALRDAGDSTVYVWPDVGRELVVPASARGPTLRVGSRVYATVVGWIHATVEGRAPSLPPRLSQPEPREPARQVNPGRPWYAHAPGLLAGGLVCVAVFGAAAVRGTRRRVRPPAWTLGLVGTANLLVACLLLTVVGAAYAAPALPGLTGAWRAVAVAAFVPVVTVPAALMVGLWGRLTGVDSWAQAGLATLVAVTGAAFAAFLTATGLLPPA